jgi:inner membrane protein
MAGLVFGCDIGLVLAIPLGSGPRRFLVTALLDETAHVLTALLLLRPRLEQPERVLATAAGSTLVDLDHLPAFLGGTLFDRDASNRPTHSLVLIAALLGLAQAVPSRRSLLRAFALGALTHLFRDLASGDVPLFTPLWRREVRLPSYGVYALLLLAAALRGSSRPTS